MCTSLSDRWWLTYSSYSNRPLLCPSAERGRLHIPRCWSHHLCSVSDGKKQAIYFGVEEMNMTIGIGGGNFLRDSLFPCIPSCSFSVQPMMTFNPLQCLTHSKQLWTAHPKGKSTQVFASNRWSCWAVLHPNALKTLTDMAWGQATAWMVVILQALPCVAIFMPPSSLWETLGDSHKFVIHHRSRSRLNAIFPQRGFIRRKFLP